MPIKHRDLTKRSVFITKNLFISAPLNDMTISLNVNPPKTFFQYFTANMTAAHKRPEYWAMTVPAAIPGNPMPS